MTLDPKFGGGKFGGGMVGGGTFVGGIAGPGMGLEL